ncbi:IS1595 family transposase [Endozoicomonas elysicola]|uniref:IS1595 family transposase n=1 Tax=Endozoicomonas elysicola TaxID=305900 RepID=UPI00191BE774|nr:IS1595 family transposase [Endozoicomonas elysicola]
MKHEKNLDHLPRKRRHKGAPGRGTLEKDKPPVLGMIQRGGQVIINMLSNVKKAIIEPFIKKHLAPQSQVYTDEYNIYDDLESWCFKHKTVCHEKGEYARDDDKDGIYEIHVNTMEGFWSLLRSWLRPHRGISQEALPLYLVFLSFA